MRFAIPTLLAASVLISATAPARAGEAAPLAKEADAAKEAAKEAPKEAGKDAKAAKAEASGLTPQEEARFRDLSRDYFRWIVPVRDNYVVIHPAWPATPNTRGWTRQALVDQLTDSVEVQTTADGRTFKEKKKTPANRDDVGAACTLRSLAPGDFGDVVSVRILKITGKDEMLVDDLRLYERDCPSANGSWRGPGDNRKVGALWREVRDNQDRMRRTDDLGYGNAEGRIFRLVGFPTADLREGTLWRGLGDKGLRVAVGWTERAQVELDKPKDIPVQTLINLDKLAKAVSDAEGFEAFLEKRRAGRADFLAIHKAAGVETAGNTTKVKAAVLRDLAMLGNRDVRRAADVPVAAVPAPPAPVPVVPAPGPKPPVATVPVPAPVPTPVPAPATLPATPPVAAVPVPAAPGKPHYEPVAADPKADAEVDLTKPTVIARQVVGRWHAKDAQRKPFCRVCAQDGTYGDFDADGHRTGGGEYRVTGKGAVVFIAGGAQGDMSQWGFKAPHSVQDDAGGEYQRMAPAK